MCKKTLCFTEKHLKIFYLLFFLATIKPLNYYQLPKLTWILSYKNNLSCKYRPS